jgi:hypothetical protein
LPVLNDISRPPAIRICIISVYVLPTRLYCICGLNMHCALRSFCYANLESPHTRIASSDPYNRTPSGKAPILSACISLTTSPRRSTSSRNSNSHPYRPSETSQTMSFEPKTKIELDPPKDDVISLDYLSKCDGELDSSQKGHTCSSDSSIAGTNPDYPTYVAIKGTIFDVTGNKAYGPEGSYKGKRSVTASLTRQAQLNQTACSFRRQGCLSCSRAVISQARGVPCRLV